MGTSQIFPIEFSPVITKIIKQQKGILGNSESEIVKNIVLFYFKENGNLKVLKTQSKKREQLG